MRDEHKFVPGLFIEAPVFTKRMQYLSDKKYNVISLQKLYDFKEKRDFPDDAIVLTIDDGFYSVLKLALPVLKKYNFPSTLYLTSYYFDKNCPIFNLAVGYMFFKTDKTNASLENLSIKNLTSQNDSEAVQKIINFAITLNTEQDRLKILRKLTDILELDYDEFNNSRILNLISSSEIKELLDDSMDIQLHTHRHKFPVDNEIASYEINKNKEKVTPHLATKMTHFCYPSGNWNKEHWPILEKNDIYTATTCESALINYNTPNYSLNRILDSSRVSQIEFEAEISGFNELIRVIRGI